MSLAPRLTPGLSQRLSLAPNLAESLRLLAMPGVELAQAIERALESNVMLERVEPEAEPAAREPEVSANTLGDYPPSPDWAALPPLDGNAAPSETGTSDETLRTHLEAQLALERLSARDYAMTEVVIDALDEDGYLRVANAALAETLAELDPPADCSEIERAIRRVQGMEPTGVAARDPAECLLLQLAERAANTAGRACAEVLIRRHFQALARTDIAALARLAGYDFDETRAALTLIHGLDPHPGYRYSAARIEYLTPELIALRAPVGWKVELNPAVSPRIRVNETYTNWLAAHHGVAGADTLAAQLEEARTLMTNLAQRGQTLLRIGTALVDRQEKFLDAGPAALVPLTLRCVAERLGLHESTVSRAVQGKSIATPRGTIALRHFFSASVSNTHDGEGFSSRAVQTRIGALIARENPAAPLSDAALVSALGAGGVRVARRTVAKYREALGLASTRERRHRAR